MIIVIIMMIISVMVIVVILGVSITIIIMKNMTCCRCFLFLLLLSLLRLWSWIVLLLFAIVVVMPPRNVHGLMSWEAPKDLERRYVMQIARGLLQTWLKLYVRSEEPEWSLQVYYAITVIRNPQYPIRIIKAPSWDILKRASFEPNLPEPRLLEP